MFAVALVVSSVMAIAALRLDVGTRVSRALSAGGLVVLLGAFAVARAGEPLVPGVLVALAPLTRSWLLMAAAVTLGLVLLDWLADGDRHAAPVAVLVVVVAALGMTAVQAPTRVLFAAAAAVAAVVVLPAAAGAARDAVLRRAIVGGALLTVSAALAVGPAAVGAAGRTLAFAGMVAGFGIVLGAPPLHRGAVRVSSGTGVWLPIAFAVAPAAVAFAAGRGLAASTAGGIAVVAATAWGLVAVVAAGAGALLERAVPRVVAYAAAGEAGLVLLAVAAADAPGVIAALEMRLVVVPAALAAAWAAASALRVGPRPSNATEIGWARRSPLAALALAASPLALYGWPGSPAWETRLLIAEAALPFPAAIVVATAGAVPFTVAVLVALATGLRPPPDARAGAPLRRHARPREPWRGVASGAVALALAALAVALAGGALGIGGAPLASAAP